MFIHSNILMTKHFVTAASISDTMLIEFNEKGSRSKDRAFKFSLSGSSPFNRGFGAPGKAATWDEWGIFLNCLFDIDPDAHCGKYSYQNREHFHWVTGDRFKFLTPEQQHKRHKWGLGQPNITGVYSVAECDCNAIMRWTIAGHSWKEIEATV